MKDGDNPALWESGAILRYLANTYAPDELWPADPVTRADVDRWAEWSKINIAMNFTAPVFWRVVRTPPSIRDSEAICNSLFALDRFLCIAEEKLSEHTFLAGEHFSLADIQFGHCLFRYYDIDIERTDHPNLLQYYNRLANRPAYREHIMISYEDLRKFD